MNLNLQLKIERMETQRHLKDHSILSLSECTISKTCSSVIKGIGKLRVQGSSRDFYSHS